MEPHIVGQQNLVGLSCSVTVCVVSQQKLPLDLLSLDDFSLHSKQVGYDHLFFTFNVQFEDSAIIIKDVLGDLMSSKKKFKKKILKIPLMLSSVNSFDLLLIEN